MISRNELSITLSTLWYSAHEGGGATSQLDLPSLTPLSVAGCCRLQLVVPHLASSVITANS